MVDTTNPLSLSDEDFLKLNEPEGQAIENPVVEEKTTEEAKTDTKPEETTEVVTEPTSEASGEQKTNEVVDSNSETKTEEKTEEVVTEDKVEDKVEDKSDAKSENKTDEVKTEEKPEAKTDGKTEEKPIDYKAQYEQLMAPIKANGKEIELKSPAELIKLAQMGADYTRKLQQMAPHRKTLLMLENNGLTEDKINFLIDLDKGNPEAIKKLLKDKGINVLDIDTESEPAYEPGDHSVSDPEVAFRTAMDDLRSSDAGRATIQEIHGNWDDKSKEALWNSPEIMAVVHQQRETGVYSQIATEVERRKTLGMIPANTPFLEAYTNIGKELSDAALQAKKVEEEAAKVLATRAATPKPTVVADDKASAASTTKAAPKQAEEKKNFLSMSDKDFEQAASLLLGR